MKRILLKVIPKPEPGTLTVIERNPNDKETLILFKGPETSPDLHCGNCMALLAAGILLIEIDGKALRCNRCGSYSTA